MTDATPQQARKPQPFAHLGAPRADLYRSVMRAFVDHKRRFVVHLRPDDVTDALRAPGHPVGDSSPSGGPVTVTTEEVESALTALAAWGNLRADPDTSRVGTVEDFYRRRFLYQLTRAGEAAERALRVYEEEIGRRGELQAVALEDIRLRLRALRELAERDDPDPAVVHSVLLEIVGRLDSLAANASAFMGSLQRTIDLQDLDEDAFFAYKDRLIAYLERFVSELAQKAYDIARTLRTLDADRLDSLLLLAARREAADAVPDPTGSSGSSGSAETAQGGRPRGDGPQDPAGVDDDPVSRRFAEWRHRWSGIAVWFVGDRLHPSQSELLRRRARKAIPDLLQAIRLLQERRSGRSDRSADFRELALWFAQAPDDEQAHRLWRAAFGLSTARHLTGQPADVDADRPVPASTSWRDAPTVEVAARLRATGHYLRRGAPARVLDRTVARDQLAAQLAAERAQTEAARRRLATGRPTRLAEIAGPDGLDRAEFALFLRLLGEALSAGPAGPDGTIRTTTADGGFELALTPLPGAAVVSLHTTEGVLYGPDHEITIVDRSLPPGTHPTVVVPA